MALSFGASTDAHAFGDLHRLRSEYSIAELPNCDVALDCSVPASRAYWKAT
jgi:hypothetical protein